MTAQPHSYNYAPSRNTIGLVALILVLVGAAVTLAAFAMPFMLFLAIPILIVALLLSIIGLTRRDQPKGTSLSTLILSIVFGVLGAILFAGSFLNFMGNQIDGVADSGAFGTLDSSDSINDSPGAAEQSDLVRTIRENFPGYPLVVDTSTLSERVSWAVETDQVVAVAPGLYAPFNPAIPDLDSYIDLSPVLGDCMMMHTYFEGHGGTCWDGVPPGTAEPALG